MLRISNNIKLKVKKKHSDFSSLMKDILKSEKKFIYEIVSNQFVIIKVNPLYRSFWMQGHNPGRFVEAKISKESLNNLNPIIEIEEETISNNFTIVLVSIVICLVLYCIWQGEFIMTIGIIALPIFSLAILHLLNMQGVATFTGEFNR